MKRLVNGYARQHPVSSFFALAFLISWGGVFAITLPSGIPSQGDTVDRLYGLVVLPMLVAPLISALVISILLEGRAGWVACRIRMHYIRSVRQNMKNQPL